MKYLSLYAHCRTPVVRRHIPGIIDLWLNKWINYLRLFLCMWTHKQFNSQQMDQQMFPFLCRLILVHCTKKRLTTGIREISVIVAHLINIFCLWVAKKFYCYALYHEHHLKLFLQRVQQSNSRQVEERKGTVCDETIRNCLLGNWVFAQYWGVSLRRKFFFQIRVQKLYVSKRSRFSTLSKIISNSIILTFTLTSLQEKCSLK
jgi:hypothetical protein